jgi:alpha-L-fucosidase 2
VRLSPTTEGPKTAYLWVSSDDPNEDQSVVVLSGRTVATLNLARLPGATATQSSTALIPCNSQLPTAARAIDGNINGNFAGCSVTHTSGLDLNAWWQVDLGTSRYIDRVNIWNRTDCCAVRLQDYDLLVSDSPLGPWQDYHQAGIAGSPTSVRVGRFARFIRIWQRRQDFLHLAEVQVFGY